MEDFPFQYFPKYFDSKGIIEKIKNQITLLSDTILIGRGEVQVEVPERRLTAWLSNKPSLTFEYSGKVMSPKPIPNFIEALRIKILEDFGIDFDGVLINYYPDGTVNMGYHADPVGDKWTSDFIILSLGSVRDFIFRSCDNYDEKVKFSFGDGDLMYMYDNCQEKYEHCLRKSKLENQERISLVFKKSK